LRLKIAPKSSMDTSHSSIGLVRSDSFSVL
jgi:hypothetical protein